MMLAITIFWISVAGILYAYVGYPALLYVLAIFKKKEIQRNIEYCPHLSLIIAVHNEQQRIHEKIDNIMALRYPFDKLEIIFASDASTDETDSIIQSYPQFKFIHVPERKGKEFAQRCAIERAEGDILVFSDVATMLDSNALLTMAANFADSSVGCVSSEDRFVDKQGWVSGEGAYVTYEMFLRRMESAVCSVVGLSGSFFAGRSEVCANWAEDLQSDFNTLLNAVKMGYRGVSDPQTLGYYPNIADEKKEFSRKVRTVLRGLSVLMRNLSIFNVFRYGLFSWELFSHKLCRWLVPFFLLLALASNLFLIQKSVFYVLTLFLQAVLYAAALAYGQSWLPKVSSSTTGVLPRLVRSLKIPYYFCTVNAAIFIAWMRYLKGERAVFWEPSKR